MQPGFTCHAASNTAQPGYIDLPSRAADHTAGMENTIYSQANTALVSRMPAKSAGRDRPSRSIYWLSTGICARPEIEQLLAQAGNLDRRTTAIRQAVDYLVQLGLYHPAPPGDAPAAGNILVVLQLTPSGLDLCRLLRIAGCRNGVAALQTHLCIWTIRLIPGQVERVLSVLSFAFQARLRGYKALVAPAAVDAVQPDVFVERDPEHFYVFVENGTDDLYTPLAVSREFTSTRQRSAPWTNQAAAHIAAQCKALQATRRG